MIRYPLGDSEVKLFPVAAGERPSRGVGEVIGVRVPTFFFADEQALRSARAAPRVSRGCRAFYRDSIGLEESGPVDDALLGARKYTCRHRATTINLWTYGAGLPRDSETAMRTIWLDDPDGNSNYFAEYADNDNTPPRAH